ncbi:Crp/Fnr family transcriptional regulator [Actinoplanes sp. DH11]|uniref:Crp/Fnr family transcriptional regulator n=1 Tax=Actinoplanes sp. DH11 TaxID=2857011 RepID=UPI001E2BF5AE|nr:Crp/Fnr family transcriptional regulator [Actinoplanes sp. DH11]
MPRSVLFLLSGTMVATAGAPAGAEVWPEQWTGPAIVDKAAVLDGRPPATGLMTLTTVSGLLLPSAAFLELLEEHPAVRRHVLTRLARDTMAARRRLVQFATLPAAARVALWLTEQNPESPTHQVPDHPTEHVAGRAAQHVPNHPPQHAADQPAQQFRDHLSGRKPDHPTGRKPDRPTERSPHHPIAWRGSQEQLARVLGLSRVTVNRALARLTRAGAVTVTPHGIVIADPAALAACAEA